MAGQGIVLSTDALPLGFSDTEPVADQELEKNIHNELKQDKTV